MRPFPKTAIRKVHPLAWLWEPMEEDATFFLRSMFGSKAVSRWQGAFYFSRMIFGTPKRT